MAWHQRVGLYLFRDRLSMDRVWPPSTAVVTPEAGVTFSLGNNSQISWGSTDHLTRDCLSRLDTKGTLVYDTADKCPRASGITETKV